VSAGAAGETGSEERMAEVQIRIQPTPNPNALLFLVDRSVTEERMRQFNSPGDAEDNPLAATLFAIDGVTSVFFMPNSITLNKESGADWGDIAPTAEEAVRAYFAEL
jgi:hypothetical protein